MINLSWPWVRQNEQQVSVEGPIEADLLFEPSERVEESVERESEWIWRPLFLLTLVLVVLGLLLSGLRSYLGWIDQQLGGVQIRGSIQHINTDSVRSLLSAHEDATLLNHDLQALHEQIVQQPWINDAQIYLRWPASIEVELTEEVPVARWGDRGLVNHQGDIFWPEITAQYAVLPRLMGPAHETERIMRQFHDLNSLFAQEGMRLSGLELESRGAWHLRLDNGLNIVAGREDLMPRLRRFIEVYRRDLAKQVAQIQEIDIRYTNGIAVRWKEVPQTSEGASPGQSQG